MPSQSYFDKLAELAIEAWKSDCRPEQKSVGELLHAWNLRAPKPIRGEPAGRLRDHWQEVLGQALNPQRGEGEINLQSLREEKLQTLTLQVENIVDRAKRINSLVEKTSTGCLGDLGWGRQVAQFCAKHELKKELRADGKLEWSAVLSPAAPKPQESSQMPRPEATRSTTRELRRIFEVISELLESLLLDPAENQSFQRARPEAIRWTAEGVKRVEDAVTMVDSFACFAVRRLAARLTVHDVVKEIFTKYHFRPSGDQTVLRELADYLNGISHPADIHQDRFENWPLAAIVGSFVQELASALDYMPSTWVLERELQCVNKRRDPSQQIPPASGGSSDPPKDRAWQMGLTGLAFSGGGIRSATFNLGILQGLAKVGMLRRFDYLSMVSGGGYIGSWLVSWIKREGLEEVERRLCPESTPDPTDLRVSPIRFLRDFSNYLTPRMGLLSADLWVMGVIWTRNTLLNLLVLLPALLAVLFLPRMLEVWAQRIGTLNAETGARLSHWYLAALISSVAWVAILVARNLRQFAAKPSDVSPPMTGEKQSWYSRPWGVLTFIVFPIFVAAWIASLELWLQSGREGPWEWQSVGAFAAVMAGVILWIAKYPHCFQETHLFGQTDRRKGTAFFLLGLVAMSAVALTLGAVTALLTMGLENIYLRWHIGRVRGFISAWGMPLEIWMPQTNLRTSAAVAVFGVPLVVLALFFVLILMVGFMSRNLRDGPTEWLARLRAYVAIYSTLWLAWFGISIYGPSLDHTFRLWYYGKWPLIATWAWTTARGVLAGKDPRTGGGKTDWKTSLGFYATVGPYVFIAGLLLALSFAVQSAYMASGVLFSGWRDAQGSLASTMMMASGHPWIWALLLCTGLSALLAFVLSFCFDLNEFSLNTFYRGRLVRCYLGASNNDRCPNPFTGFDPQDDAWPLASFKKGAPKVKADDRDYDGPLPIYNATLNLVHGDELAWQERKGASFTFTPELCGYETPWHAPANPQPFQRLKFLGYRETEDYAYPKPGVHLGTPMSISGAALSPNMGFYTRAATGFLMTVFNARLGWWLGNPRHNKTWRKAGPTQGLAYLMKELLGLTNDRAGFVYLSDGGHFENLAIYELVRRRCRFIVTCDAEEDAGFGFNGLGNAIRKCREDFGVEIDVRVDLIKPDPATSLSRSHCVVGTIRYPDQPGLGYLVYLKASIVGDEPEDVLQYRVTCPVFPHQSTGDQWFTESQFESYRRLGLHIAETTFQRAIDDLKNKTGETGYALELFEQLRDNWYPPNKAIQKNFTKHAQALDALVREMRSDRTLIKLDTMLIPVKEGADPLISEAEKPKVFLFLSSVIQLMENIYLDLELENNADHPHNAGWIQIFQAWAQVRVFQEAWERYSWSYGRNFRRFCKRRFGLPGV